MSKLTIQITTGLIALAVVLFLLWRARSRSALERIESDKQKAKIEEIKNTSHWLEAFVGYYERGDANQFFDAVRVEESDTPIADVYVALERVGAAAIVPPLKRAADACVQFHQIVDGLNHEVETETVREAEDEYRRVTRQSDMEIRGLGINVYDLLHEFRLKNIEGFR